MKHSGYYTRAMRASDTRYRRVFERLGYGRRDMRAAEPAEAADDLAALRAEYLRVVGKRPFMGWDAEALRQKMAEASEGDDE